MSDMSIVYPSRKTYRGFWAFPEESLSQLEKLAEEFRSEHATDLKSIVERKKVEYIKERDYLDNPEKEWEESLQKNSIEESTVTFTLKDKDSRKVLVHSVREAKRDPSIIDFLPTHFTFEFKIGGTTLTIESLNDNEVTISISGEYAKISTLLFLHFEDWIKESVTIQRPFAYFTSFYFSFLFLPVLICVWGFAIETSLTWDDVVIPTSEVRSLMEDGISEEETSRALELLLARTFRISLENSESSEKQPFPISLWYWYTIPVFLSVLWIYYLLHPKSVVGIGKGKEKLQRWLKVDNWIGKLPYMVVVYLLIPIGRNLLPSV